MSDQRSNPYMSVEIFDDRRLVKLTRSSLPFDSLEAIERCFGHVELAMGRIHRARYAQLQDLRSARGRNDPAFESAIASRRLGVSTGFRKLAIVVQTPAGKMQLERYLKQDGLEGRVFFDEEAALRWLAS